jgi:tetratricopeptide (TPR) repeat protein
LGVRIPPGTETNAIAAAMAEPLRLRLNFWHRAAFFLALVGVAIVLFCAYAHGAKSNFLPADDRAEWIVFPVALDAHAHPVVSADTVFRREFTLDGQPRTARLSVRAAKRVQLRINGSPVEIGSNRLWKEISTLDVARWLRAGPNIIEVRAFNDVAPAALWLVLTADQLKLRSDQSWQASLTGSAWRDSAFASKPRFPGNGNLMAGGERTFTATGKIWPIWCAVGGIALFLCWATYCWRDRISVAWLLLAVAALWIALFLNNAGSLSPHTGFDAQAHLDYIKYVQERRALPLPTEGFEMFQPPLYYILSAAILSSCSLSVNDASGILVLRLLTMLFGIAQFSLVFLSMRLLFPNRIGRQLIGLLIGAFLPMQFYLSHYLTNETLAATLTTLAIYFGLRLLRTKKTSPLGHGALGLALGAAILTKTTAVLLLPPLLAALAIKFASQRSTLAKWMRTLGVTLAVCFAVCAWHYIRIWMHFGAPFIGNWEIAAGSPWWQDPGYHTANDYLRFGRSLIVPFFAGFSGFADGIYSTVWGDGLCGGWDLIYRPPWNYDLMVGGYLLGLGPSLLVMIGAGVALYRYLREPLNEWLLLLGFSAAVLCGIILMTLNVPSYAQVKGFYGLSALVPFCFFGATGWDALTHRHRFLRFAVGALLVAWAMNSFAAVWIVPSASQHLYAGRHLRLDGKLDAAVAEARAAVSADASSAATRCFLASVLNDLNRPVEAAAEAQRGIELNSSDYDSHLQLATAFARQGQLEQALDESRRAAELGPENPFAYNLLLNCLLQKGRTAEAIATAREALALAPLSPELHYNLGAALAAKGDPATAAIHFGYAVLLRPDWKQAYDRFPETLLSVANAPEGAKQLQELAMSAPDSPRVREDLAAIRANFSAP